MKSLYWLYQILHLHFRMVTSEWFLLETFLCSFILWCLVCSLSVGRIGQALEELISHSTVIFGSKQWCLVQFLVLCRLRSLFIQVFICMYVQPANTVWLGSSPGFDLNYLLSILASWLVLWRSTVCLKFISGGLEKYPLCLGSFLQHYLLHQTQCLCRNRDGNM